MEQATEKEYGAGKNRQKKEKHTAQTERGGERATTSCPTLNDTIDDAIGVHEVKAKETYMLTNWQKRKQARTL